MNSLELQKVNKGKDLGGMITGDRNPSKHCTEAVEGAYKMH